MARSRPRRPRSVGKASATPQPQPRPAQHETAVTQPSPAADRPSTADGRAHERAVDVAMRSPLVGATHADRQQRVRLRSGWDADGQPTDDRYDTDLVTFVSAEKRGEYVED